MTTESFRIEVHSAAPKATVFEVLADVPHWQDWAPMVRRSTWEREGSPEPGGVGAIRRVGAPPVFAREEIVEYEPPRRMVYVLLSGMPVRDYRAEVVLSDGAGGGTDIVWSSSLVPRIPFTGAAMRVVMRGIMARMARRLAAQAARVAGAGTGTD